MGLAEGRPRQDQETRVNKAAYTKGVVAALVEAGLLKSADANALAEQLSLEPDVENRPLPPRKKPSVPDYEDDDTIWSSRGSTSNSVLQNLGIEVRGPESETY